MDLQLKGKTALITGGSIGIGFAVARGFAEEGVRVAVCARDGDRVSDAAKQIAGEFGVDAKGFAADVSRPADVGFLAEAVHEHFGPIDILVNNAGTGSEETIMDAEDEKWQYYWDLHVMAAIRTARAFVPGMRSKGGGVILNNASICAKQPLYYEPIYNTTKAALIMMTKCLANELIGDNIRVNAINPGLVLTPDWRNTASILGKEEGISPEEYLDRIAKEHTPIGRFATPEEIASYFVFLCSPKASYSVGSSYFVDGGWLRVVE